MLLPKRTKHRKVQKGRMKGQALRGGRISYGEYGLVATEPCWVESRQIEAARIAMTRYMNRQGKVWIRVFPHMPQTKKPLAVRMGGGKGSPEGYVAVVKKGTIMFEVGGVSYEIAREAFRLAGAKLPIGTKTVTKEYSGE